MTLLMSKELYMLQPIFSVWWMRPIWGLVSTHCCPQFWVSKLEKIPHRFLNNQFFKFHTVFWTSFLGFRADKISTTHWSGCRVQVWVHFRAPASLLAIIPGGYSRRQMKVLAAKSMAELLGLRSSTTGMCFQIGSNRCWQQQACCRKMCYSSCDTDSIWESKRI